MTTDIWTQLFQEDPIVVLNYLIAHWHYIAFYTIDGLSIAIMLQWFKRHFKVDEIERTKLFGFIKVNGKHIVVIILTILAGVSTAATWLVDPNNSAFIPQQYAGILLAAFYIHRFFVSPVGSKIEKALQPYWEAVGQIKEQESLPQATQTTLLPPAATPTTIPVVSAPSVSLPPAAPAAELTVPVGSQG